MWNIQVETVFKAVFLKASFQGWMSPTAPSVLGLSIPHEFNDAEQPIDRNTRPRKGAPAQIISRRLSTGPLAQHAQPAVLFHDIDVSDGPPPARSDETYRSIRPEWHLVEVPSDLRFSWPQPPGGPYPDVSPLAMVIRSGNNVPVIDCKPPAVRPSAHDLVRDHQDAVPSHNARMPAR